MPKGKSGAAPQMKNFLDTMGESPTAEEEAANLAEEQSQEVVEPQESETQEPAEQSAAAKKGEETPAKQSKGEEFVPRSRLNEVIAQREAKEKEAQEFRDKWNNLMGKQELAREAQQRADEAAKAAEMAKLRPDPELDPAGARAWDAEQRAIRAEQVLQQLQAQVQQTQQSVQQNQVDQQFNAWVNSQAQQGRTKVADYDARIDYTRNARFQWWSSLMPAEQAREMVAREEQGIVALAMQRGIPLSDVVTQLSNMFAYPGNGAAQPNGQANGNGAVQPNGQVRQAQVMPDASEKIRQIQAGQAAQGLGRVQSGQSMALKNWQTMDDNEFAEYVVGLPDETYIDMINDPRTGKEFHKKVLELG